MSKLGLADIILAGIVTNFIGGQIKKKRKSDVSDKRAVEIKDMVSMFTAQLSKDNITDAHKERLMQQIERWTSLYERECGVLYEIIFPESIQ